MKKLMAAVLMSACLLTGANAETDKNLVLVKDAARGAAADNRDLESQTGSLTQRHANVITNGCLPIARPPKPAITAA